MNKEELLTVFSNILKEDDILKTGGIKESNHRPHQFTVSKKHVDYANEHNEGVLTEEICQMFKCGVKKCKLKYEDHTCDMQLVLQLKQDVTQQQAHDQLLKLQSALKEHGVKEIAFAEDEEGHKFI